MITNGITSQNLIGPSKKINKSFSSPSASVFWAASLLLVIIRSKGASSVGVDYGYCASIKEGLCASATAAAVADESNARVTISAALAASVAGWDVSGNARLPPGSLFIVCGQDIFFSRL